MTTIHHGRHTAEIDGDYVVFVIGMRINKLWKVHRWLPVSLAMPRMIRELMQHPEKGMLGARNAFAGRTTTMIQYWRSFEHLEAFARNPSDPHLPAWRAFNRAIGSSGDVGVYHETYCVSPGDAECIYVNMPTFGLAAAREARHVSVGHGTTTARQRMTGDRDAITPPLADVDA
jgi:hypothetical protein